MPNTSNEQITTWLNSLRNDTNFVWTQGALTSIPVVQRDARLPAALMLIYLQRRISISSDWQARFVLLMRTMLEKGHTADGLLNRKPVWLYILRFRFVDLYRLLKLPSQPSVAVSIQLAGFFGALVKATLNVQVNKDSVDSVIQGRQAHFDYRELLSVLSNGTVQQVSISELMNAVNRLSLPALRDVDVLKPYQVVVHSKLPKLGRFLIHEAILNGHVPLFETLCQRDAHALSMKDNWSRTALHLISIFDLQSAVTSIEFPSQFEAIRDGFGRTYKDIEMWKRQRVNTSKTVDSDSANGGWKRDYLSDYRTQKQEIDVVDYQDLPWQKFQERYASCAKPVLIRGVPNVDVLQKKWKREQFERRFATLPVEVGDIPYARSLGREGGLKSFAEYRTSRTEYAFVQLHPKQHGGLLNDIPKLGYISNLVEVHTQFYQGRAGTGAPMHLHIDAWNCLVYGEKRWFLMPPFQGAYSAMPIRQWVDELYPSMQVLECTQRAGDILYVPKYWSHAVLNTRESIGIAREFFNPYLS